MSTVSSPPRPLRRAGDGIIFATELMSISVVPRIDAKMGETDFLPVQGVPVTPRARLVFNLPVAPPQR